LPGLAVTYVLYPSFVSRGADSAVVATKRLLRNAAVLGTLPAVPLALAAGPLLPFVYGPAFRSSVTPSYILLLGLCGELVAGLVTAALLAMGRPGLNSLCAGVGVVLTVALDLVLIPRAGAVGAAWASSAAYLATTAALLTSFWVLTSRRPRLVASAAATEPA
jgi:O-antigen/teichoic acid export membrane protein